ncbi:hypothetical protein [Paraburkholderia fungorum]|jgi:3-oxoadipate enol-lactonase|uniref:hypothetical protein n=1 Tax=Paraburkholderia fungorum TaxID=134537 RepID=UPI000DB1DB1C|nr:hypothetical protein [Paraburkholderia fungorum]PZR50061.1 MAG: hypothetical protein DI523_06115 [Paraburkholderia fungorum]
MYAGTRLDRLVLCATAAKIGTEEGWNARIDAVKTNGLGTMTGATAERWFTSQFRSAHKEAVGGILETFAGVDSEGYNGRCTALAAADLREEVRRIAHPVLAISGSDDSVCPPGDLKYIADNVQRGKHVALPGRRIVNVESAQEFNAALLGFLIE